MPQTISAGSVASIKTVHLCAHADLGFKLKTFNGQGGPNATKDSGNGTGKGKQGKDSPGKNIGIGAAGKRQVTELQNKYELEKKFNAISGGGGTVEDPEIANSKTVAGEATEKNRELLTMLRRNKATNLQWIKFQREEHMAPGNTEDERESWAKITMQASW